MERCEISLIRIDAKHIGVPCIITKLIRTVNHFTGLFILPINSQSDQLFGIKGYWRAAEGVYISVST